MAQFNWTPDKVNHYYPTVESEPVIDLFFEPGQCATIYAAWKSEWGEVLDFGGGVKGITIKQVAEVPKEEFITIPNLWHADEIWEECNRLYKLEPFH